MRIESESQSQKRLTSTICHICTRPVPLESAVTDESGRAVHELCYVICIRLLSRSKIRAA